MLILVGESSLKLTWIPKNHALEKDFSIGTVGITAVHLRFRGRTLRGSNTGKWKMNEDA